MHKFIYEFLKDKIIPLVLFSLALLSICACNKGGMIINQKPADVGTNFFNRSNSDVPQIIFFDSDNIVNSEDGSSFDRTYLSNAGKSVNSSESYMIKCGNIEMLVDAGCQTQKPAVQETSPYAFNSEVVANCVQNNLLKKIASLCSDGVLEYLVVTHADMDHIGSLVVENGVIDAFLEKKTIKSVDGTDIPLTSITNFVDFDSGVVALHSNLQLDRSSRLVDSDIYPTYLAKKEALINAGTNYLPAAALFDSVIKTSNDESMSIDEKNKGRPTDYLNKSDNQLISELFGTEKASEYINSTKKNKDYYENVVALGGGLKKIDDKFVYSIEFGSSELRFLYNWFYDYGERHGFNSQDRNNISVCIELVCGQFKFMSLGDLGGRGENGLLNYYKDTSILKNVTCFKSSHHGSTNNLENSERLFKEITPKIISIIGCAQVTIDNNGTNSSAAFVKQKFLDNLYSGLKENAEEKNPFIFYTNISCYRFDSSKGITVFESNPFYGDIKVKFSGGQVDISNSYIGEIKAYISQQINTEYKKVNGHEYFFSTRNNLTMVKFQECDWFKRVGFTYGGK